MENIPSDPSPAAPSTSEPTAQQGSYQRPADYYATPPDQKSGCGKSTVVGCGLAGCLVLVLMFVGGALLLRGGMSRVIDFALARLDTEAVGMMSRDVTPQQRADFQSELSAFRENAKARRIELIQVQPVLQELRDTTSDNVLTPQEVTGLTDAMREVNSRARTQPR